MHEQEHHNKTFKFSPRLIRAGEMGTAKDTGTLDAILGSCVAVVLYEPRRRIAAMAHVFLPSSSGQSEGKKSPAKYAESAIPALLLKLQQEGVDPKGLRAKLAGGADMFSESKTQVMSLIGKENERMLNDRLKQYNIPVTGRDTGGVDGRTVSFDVATSRLHVHIAGRSKYHI